MIKRITQCRCPLAIGHDHIDSRQQYQGIRDEGFIMHLSIIHPSNCMFFWPSDIESRIKLKITIEARSTFKITASGLFLLSGLYRSYALQSTLHVECDTLI